LAIAEKLIWGQDRTCEKIAPGIGGIKVRSGYCNCLGISGNA